MITYVINIQDSIVGGGKNFLKNLFSTQIALIIIFFLFFAVEYNTPFHSDDFFYGQMGLNPENHIKHYLNWSGRLVADYSSSFILLFYKNHLISSVIIAFISTLECYLIAAIPCKILNMQFSTKKLTFLFVVYWVSNPSLGHINFWIVGACNYLITTTLVLLLLYVYVIFKDGVKNRYLPIFFFLGLVAGCSNENMGISLLLFLVSIVCFYKYFKISFDKKLLLIVFIGSILGTLTLILAPGNYERLSDYESWNTLSLLEKIILHIRRTGFFVPKLFKLVLIVYLFYFVITVTRLGKIWPSDKQIVLSIIFLFTSCFAVAVMVFSPYIIPRSLAGSFVFLLLALSCILIINLKKTLLKMSVFFLYIFFFYQFVLSYSCVYGSYSLTKIQSTLRNEAINYEKLVKGTNSEVTVPGYYFLCLKNNGDMFSTFNSDSEKKWFCIKNLIITSVNYDYSVIKTGNEITLLNKSNLKNIRAIFKGNYWFSNKGTLLLESDFPLPKEIIVFYFLDRDQNPRKLVLSDNIKIKGKYYLGATGDFGNISSILLR